MKKKKLILLFSLPVLLFSCERTSANSENSSSTYSSTTTSSSSSSISSSKKTSSSISQEKAEFTKLKSALTYVSRQDKMEVSTANGSLSLKEKGKEIKTETSTEDDDIENGDSSSSSSSEEITTTTETPFDYDISASNLSLDLACKGLKETAASKINASLVVSTDLSINNTKGSGEDASTSTLSKEDVELKAYVKDNYAYLNLDNEALQSIIKGSSDNSTIGGMSILLLGKYLKASLSNFTFPEGTFPLNNLQESDVLSIVNTLSSLDNSTQGLFTFRNDEDYTYMDFTLSTFVLRALPDLVKGYLEGNLDPESDDYESQKKEIEDNINTVKQYTNNLTVNKGDFSLGYTTTGIKSFSFDLDLSGTNFDVNSSDSSTDKTHYDSFSIKTKSTLSFKYQDDVTIQDPGTHLWFDISYHFQ